MHRSLILKQPLALYKIKSPVHTSSKHLTHVFNLLLINGVCSSYAVELGSLPFKVFTLLTLWGAMFLLYKCAFLELRSGNKSLISANYRLLLLGILIIGALNIIRGFKPEFKVFTDALGLPGTGMAWLIPIAVFCGTRLSFWKKLIPVFTLHVILGILLFILLIVFKVDLLSNSPEFLNWSFLYPSGFLLLNWKNQNKKINLVAIVGLVCFALNGLLMGRRYLLLMAIIYFLFFLKSISHKTTSVFKSFFVNYTLIACVLTAFLAYPQLLKVSENVQYEENSSYNMVLKKGFNNSRTGFYEDLIDDLSFNELLLGRGVLGTYQSKIVGATPYHSLRNNIEIGYLQVILKCGALMLLLFLLFVIPPGVGAVLYGNNSFILASGFVVVSHLIEMFIFGLPTATCAYLLFWISVGACLNTKLRKNSNLDTKHLFIEKLIT